MSDILVRLIGLGNEVGTVTSANMYDDGYMAVFGKTANGNQFSITFNVKEETANDKS